MERPTSQASVALSFPNHVALVSFAAVCLIIGAAFGRTCGVTCPVGRYEFRAKMTICDDGKAYQLTPTGDSAYTATSTEAVD